MPKSNPLPQTVPVWDLPTRLFHWTLVALMIAQWLTTESDSALQYHVWGGYTVLTLVLFRLMWGFAGSDTARFSHFVRGPDAALEYVKALLRGETPLYLGHNPMGGWSILALLTLLLIQAGTGLFANDDIAFEGPLYALVGKEFSDRVAGIHRLIELPIILLVLAHLGAIIFYVRFKKQALIMPMITGWKVGAGETAQGGGPVALIVALLIALAVAYGVSGIWLPPPPLTPETPNF